MVFGFMPSPIELLILGGMAVGLAVVVGIVVAVIAINNNRPNGQ
jgi:hypothetical protein